MADDLAFSTATELAEALRERRISARELVDHYLDRIARLNPAINAVVTLDAGNARRSAEAADAATARGESRGRLHGLPVTIKDSIDAAGLRTTQGSPLYAGNVPAADAPAVARLRAAGAIVVGKTNLPLFALDVQSYNEVFGTTRNPWDVTRSPGGSSGGSAAALAAGLSALDLGSDLGGSIRLPAHYCGVYGHKPSYGTVPLRSAPSVSGVLSEADISVVGPLARGADDLDLALDVIAGPDEARRVAWKLDLPPPRHDTLSGYRIAAWLDDPACPVDDAVAERLEAAAAALSRAGAHVDAVARPSFAFRDAAGLFERLMQASTSMGRSERTFERLVREAEGAAADSVDPRQRMARNATQRHRDWLIADNERALLRAAFAAFFRDYDAIIAPVSPVAAIEHDQTHDMFARRIRVNGKERPYFDQLTWCGVFGVAYLPATVAPVGRTAAGLPVGIQIVAPYLEDRTSIDLARRLGRLIGGFEAPPGF